MEEIFTRSALRLNYLLIAPAGMNHSAKTKEFSFQNSLRSS